MTNQDLLTLKNAIDEKLKQYNIAQGQKKQILQQVTDLGFDSVKAMNAEIEKLELEVKDLETKLEESVSNLKATYPTIFEGLNNDF